MSSGHDLLAAIAARLAYKPGHRFGARRIDDAHTMVSIHCDSLPDASQGTGTFGLGIHERVAVDAVRTSVDALAVFARLVARYEAHEAAEFFRLDGASVFLPHRPGAEHQGVDWDHIVRLDGKFLRCLHERLDGDER